MIKEKYYFKQQNKKNKDSLFFKVNFDLSKYHKNLSSEIKEFKKDNIDKINQFKLNLRKRKDLFSNLLSLNLEDIKKELNYFFERQEINFTKYSIMNNLLFSFLEDKEKIINLFFLIIK